MDSVCSSFKIKKGRNTWPISQRWVGCVYVHRDIPAPPQVVPICVVTCILPIPLPAEYLLKWLLKQGALQQPLLLHAQVFEKIIFATPGKCQRLEPNFFMLTLSLKLLSHFPFPATPKENTEIPQRLQ